MQYSREDVSIGFFGHIVNQDVLGAGKKEKKSREKTGAIHEENTLELIWSHWPNSPTP